jgi:putative N6-adenine-specific DNA methylase
MLSLGVVTAPGLEPITLREMQDLSVDGEIEETGLVVARGDRTTLMRLNLHLRTATRVLVRAAQFHASSFAELERRSRDIAWEQAIRADRPVRLRVTCRKSRLYHSDAVAERIARSIQRRLATQVQWSSGGDGDTRGDALEDAQLVIVRLMRDVCTLSFDSSGAALHARGYREAVAKAPLRESLAAAMLLAGEWRHDAPLLDPMCGSGTIPIEAALMSRRVAPGLERSFAFQWWAEHDAALWEQLRDRAGADALESAPAPIFASDRDAGAIAATLSNAERGTISEIEPPAVAGGWVVSNPPYGVRVSDSAQLYPLYARLGDVLREHCGGWNVILLTADPRMERATRLSLEERFRTRNGGIPVRCMAARVPVNSPDARHTVAGPAT